MTGRLSAIPLLLYVSILIVTVCYGNLVIISTEAIISIEENQSGSIPCRYTGSNGEEALYWSEGSEEVVCYNTDVVKDKFKANFDCSQVVKSNNTLIITKATFNMVGITYYCQVFENQGNKDEKAFHIEVTNSGSGNLDLVYHKVDTTNDDNDENCTQNITSECKLTNVRPDPKTVIQYINGSQVTDIFSKNGTTISSVADHILFKGTYEVSCVAIWPSGRTAFYDSKQVNICRKKEPGDRVTSSNDPETRLPVFAIILIAVCAGVIIALLLVGIVIFTRKHLMGRQVGIK